MKTSLVLIGGVELVVCKDADGTRLRGRFREILQQQFAGCSDALAGHHILPCACGLKRLACSGIDDLEVNSALPSAV